MKAWLLARTVKEWLALIALFGSLVGAGVLTGNRIWLIGILERAEQWVAIADLAKLDTLILGAILIGLGFAINKRSIKITKDGIDASGGE